MEATLIELAKQCPDLTISVKASDLLEVGRTIKEELLQELNLPLQESLVPKQETFLSREETMSKLKVSAPTLWRWSRDYLVPEKIGNNVRYRMSDIEKRLEESKYVR